MCLGLGKNNLVFDNMFKICMGTLINQEKKIKKILHQLLEANRGVEESQHSKSLMKLRCTFS